MALATPTKTYASAIDAAKEAPPALELTVFGQLVGASGLNVPSSHAEWKLRAGDGWTLAAGEASGSTQCDWPTASGAAGVAHAWHHPVDARFTSTSGLAGWPRLEIEVRQRDEHGRSDLAGYAVAHVPTAPGAHTLTAAVWRPRGSALERLAASFVGGRPALRDRELVFGSLVGGSLARGELGEKKLVTAPAGTVHLLLNVAVRHTAQQGRKR